MVARNLAILFQQAATNQVEVCNFVRFHNSHLLFFKYEVDA